MKPAISLPSLVVALLFVFGGRPAAGAAESKFDFDTLRARARALAAKPHAPPQGEVPAWLRQLDYDDLRLIEFKGPLSLWHEEKLLFQVQYLHPGFLFDKMVHLHEVRGGQARPIPFRREYFNYRTVKSGEIPPDLGFAGFRLMFPFGGPGTPHNEIGSFAGASYFRFLSAGAAYGLSARGLALNTWEPEGEEFPVFTEFWFERGDTAAKSLTLYALLEGESVTGAYRFTVTPGAATVVGVKATLYCRKNAKVFGVAPLTSMFWHAENSATTRDFRPEVHDSDGLLIHNGAGEWIWRPLTNPGGVRVSSFSDHNPRAFGLLQRDRDFESYQDLEALYHARPSLLVEPIGQWGRGAVRLVEIPTTTEFDDNIVAFWVPEKLPPPGEAIEVEYRLTWGLGKIGPPAGFVRATRHGKSARYEPGFERFVIDFAGAPLEALGAEAKLEHAVTVGDGGKLNHAALQKNSINGTWRVAFTVKPDGSGRPIELRCFLKHGTKVLTETWSYLWQP
ncbi:MAG: glucan biosynthesis protein [Opitutaceae bacterium]|nr:glucan biosynthesis protein [Opitutaceae bacterium]